MFEDIQPDPAFNSHLAEVRLVLSELVEAIGSSLIKQPIKSEKNCQQQSFYPVKISKPIKRELIDSDDDFQTTISFETIEADEAMLELDAYFKHIEDFSQEYKLDCTPRNLNGNGLLMSTLKCDACGCKYSLFWRRVTRQQIICNVCFYEKAYLILFDDEHLHKKLKTTKDQSINNFNESATLNSNAIYLTTDGNTNGNNKKKLNNGKNGKNPYQSSHSQNSTDNTRPLTRTARKTQVETVTTNTPISTTNSKPTLQTQLSTSSNCSSSSNSNTNQTTATVELVNANDEVSQSEQSNTTRKSARILKAKQCDSETALLVGSSLSGASLPESGESVSVKMEQEPEERTKEAAVAVVTSVATNRRSKFFKKKAKPPVKLCETSVLRLTNSEYVFHRGVYMQMGDIVALLDKVDNTNIYFAQIRAFMVDECGQKSAVLTWLIPTSIEHKAIKCLKDFDPGLFVLGPAEEYPRPLDCMEFVCRLDEMPKAAFSKQQFNENGYFDNLIRYKNNLLKHKFAIADLASETGNGLKLITKKYLNGNDENGGMIVDHGIQCK